MSQQNQIITACDQCGGEIPFGADCIKGVSGTLTVSGTQTPFQAMDFCCTEHMLDWVSERPQVGTPNPMYPAPGTSTPVVYPPVPVPDPNPPAPPPTPGPGPGPGPAPGPTPPTP